MSIHNRPAQANDGPQIGTVLLGKYTVERVIGRGGMAYVVAAYHADLRQHVAIKLLRPEVVTNQGMVERFMREARASARLESEHVVKIIDVGKLENGVPYMVMEYLDGQDLRGVLAENGSVPPVVAVDYILQAIDAIAEAHSQGIIHRDLKPANIFLASRSGGSQTIKVLDFGVAKVHEGESSILTGTKMLLGSPRYMSPEQFRSAKNVDQRTDVWALGAILYRLISGAPPFDGEGMAQVMNAILNTTPESLSTKVSGVPRALDAIVFRCLEKDAAGRYSNVAALARALAPFGSGKYARCVERAGMLLGFPPESAVSRSEPPVEKTEQLDALAFAETRIAPMPSLPKPMAIPVKVPTLPPTTVTPAPTPAPWRAEPTPLSSARRRADRTAAAIGVGAALAIALFIALVMHLAKR